MITFRNPASVHAPLAAYSHQAELSGSARLLIISGQVGMRQDGGLPVDPVEQLEIALENLQRNLEAAQMSMQDIVKLTVFLVGEVDTARRRAVMAAKLREHRPCMTTVFAAALASPAYKVEVEAWASRDA